MSHAMRQVMHLVVHHVMHHVKRQVTRQPARPPIHLPTLLLALATLAGCATAPSVVPPAASPIASSIAPPTPSSIAPPTPSPIAPPTTLAAPAPARSLAATALHTLFDASWNAAMQRYPEWATYVGDNRWGDRLYDASPENEAAGYADLRQQLAAAQAVDRGALDARDRTSLDLFMHGQQQWLAMEPFVGYRRMSLGALGGFHTELAELMKSSPVQTRLQAEQALSRLAAWPRRVDQELLRLRQGLALGWVPPRPVIARVLEALDRQTATTAAQSPWFEPFGLMGLMGLSGLSGRELPADQQAALRQRALQLIDAQVLPAQRRLRDFVAGDYAAAAPESGNLGRYPGGAAVYAAVVRSQTTTSLSPAQIHAIGLAQVALLRGEIDQVMKAMAWTSDFASFVRHLNTDPKFFHTSPEALLAGYRDIGKRLDAELPKLFAELPRAPWGVRAMPAHAGPDAAESYDSPALDGSRPGWFNANAAGYKTRPIWGMETLTAHEAVPGHHLQTARATELGDLPRFRRSSGYVAYGEGWALYAETLGFELGLYKDPASRFGHLQMQMLRATRLVVDTGLHDLNWPRQQAIAYMVAQTGLDPGFVSSEVDRYTSWPGQALGYMIGQLKIIELRDRARTALGDRFDIRRFHMVLLDQGAVPLTVLERQVDDWIASSAATR